MSLIVQHPKLQPYIDNPWTLESLDELHDLLVAHGTFEFRHLETGLYPAAVAVLSLLAGLVCFRRLSGQMVDEL